MFDLEHHLARWRADARAVHGNEDLVDELEDHLRDGFARRERRGMPAEEAFRAAVADLGEEQAFLRLAGDDRGPVLAAFRDEVTQPHVEVALQFLALAVALETIRLEDRSHIALVGERRLRRRHCTTRRRSQCERDDETNRDASEQSWHTEKTAQSQTRFTANL